MTSWKIISSAIGASTLTSVVLVWLCQKWISARLTISLDIKENALQARKSCGQKRQTELEYCHENREKIDSILSELRKELRIIMSGAKSK